MSEAGNCWCIEKEDELTAKHLSGRWMIEDFCSEWHKLSTAASASDNAFIDGVGCACPDCGRLICGWCV